MARTSALNIVLTLYRVEDANLRAFLLRPVRMLAVYLYVIFKALPGVSKAVSIQIVKPPS
jgi:hypothetical protein